MKNILYLTLFVLLFSCSKSAISPQQETDPIAIRNNAVNLLLKNQVDIAPTIIPEQLKIKTIIGSAKHIGTFGNFVYQYDDKNRLTNISSNPANSIINSFFFEAKYDDANKIITVNGKTYNVDATGKISTLSNSNNYPWFVYKNGFPLQEFDSFTNKYDSKGNITESLRTKSNEELKFTFEYTDLPNNIRQEIISSSAIQIGFRDTYSGNFSTNLIKKCTVLSGIMKDELSFSYEFDDKGRVSKMLIDRFFGNTNLNYVYEYTYF